MMFGIKSCVNNINTIQLLSEFKLNQYIIRNSCFLSNVYIKSCAQQQQQHHHNGWKLLSGQSCTFNPITNRWISNTKPAFGKYETMSRKIRQFIRIIRLKDRGIEHNYKQDKTDRDFDTLIYRGEFTRNTTFWFLLMGSLTNMGLVYLWIKLNITDSNLVEQNDSIKVWSYKYGILIILAYVTMGILVARRYVLRIYYNQFENKFILSIYRWYFPFSTTTFTCNYGEPVVAKRLANYYFGNCKIKNRRYTIDNDNFIYALYCNLFYGYETPETFERFIDRKA